MSDSRQWFGGTRKLDVENGSPRTEDVCCERMALQLTQQCELHSSRYDCPDSLLHRVRGGYGLVVLGTDSVVEIAFCPWCGTRLPAIEDVDLPIGANDV
jgi:hypothetical protein